MARNCTKGDAVYGDPSAFCGTLLTSSFQTEMLIMRLMCILPLAAPCALADDILRAEQHDDSTENRCNDHQKATGINDKVCEGVVNETNRSKSKTRNNKTNHNNKAG